MIAAATPVRRIIRGDWMEDGYRKRRDRLTVIVTSPSEAYAEDHILPPDMLRISIDEDDELRFSGACWQFLPDVGELERVGLTDLPSARKAC